MLEFSLAESLAVLATVCGALVSVYPGYKNSQEAFSSKKLTSAIITAVMGSITLINFGVIADQSNSMNLVAFLIVYFVLGYGTDKGLAKLDQEIGFSKKASKGSGIWGTENTVKQLDGRIAFLQRELINSQKELKKYQTMNIPNKEFQKIIIDLVQREISKTQRELTAVLQEKQDLEREGWI